MKDPLAPRPMTPAEVADLIRRAKEASLAAHEAGNQQKSKSLRERFRRNGRFARR